MQQSRQLGRITPHFKDLDKRRITVETAPFHLNLEQNRISLKFSESGYNTWGINCKTVNSEFVKQIKSTLYIKMNKIKINIFF